MIDLVGLVVAMAVGALMAGIYVAGAYLGPARRLDRIERQLAGLQREVAVYRATHQQDATMLAERLDALDKTAARAANEVRMASGQVMACLATHQRTAADRADRVG